MNTQQAIQLFQSLPANLQREVKDFIAFLAQRNETSEPAQKDLAAIRKSNFGRLKGKIVIKPGFDDPIEGFEEYMP